MDHAKRKRISERHYILATQLAKFRVVEDVLRGIVAFEDLNTEEEMRQVGSLVVRMRERYERAIDPQEDV